ncbi:MAG: hypothetical protein UX20_C0005G0003 [Candidatus Magasanikbacteria bacterium GW2011_GWC2_45_8]|uniref:FG-GAP repeat protein n=1 Tax=Candidatus Magasanikbacteria bacterium GW2011_GWC2_45_8 TaxID=1619050 RepID=A0A0G1QZT8_9BACT|nr:MAG: hypothetical protein UX20_C0005G0003 [Candidatus Magasanikbacteria bacterium GW2011_GWC2_45_8]
MFQKFKYLYVFGLIASLLAPRFAADAYQMKTTFPKRANYFLSWDLSEAQARELSRWDLVILDMEHAARNPEKIRLMRSLNPSIIILAYITSQEIRDDALEQKMYTPLRYELAQRIDPSWNLQRPNGALVRFWPGAHVLNLTTQAPAVNGARWIETLGNFVSTRILASGLWDGVFLDNTWNSLSNQVGGQLDINRDGVAESTDAIDRAYVDGFNALVQNIRASTGDRYLIMGNDGERFVQFNGMMFENFPLARGWSATMKQYTDFTDKSRAPSFAVINANTNNTGDQNQLQAMRFGLASTLLGDGYYAFDFGDQNHGQTWWYDEYEALLGEPTSAPYVQKNGSSNFVTKGIWRRDYTHGLVLVNTADTAETLDLNADFEKIKGMQDIGVNDGQIVNAVSIPPHDGLILLRPLDFLEGAPYVNGAFIRIYHADGTQLRNGFFSYNESFLGGQTIAHIDLDRDDTLETIVIEHNRAVIKEGNTVRATMYPFGTAWRGELSVSAVDTGDANGLYLVFGQKTRGGKVAVTRADGAMVTRSFDGIRAGFAGGVTVSAGHLSNSASTEIVVGTANGASLVKVFSLRGKLLSAGWNVFGKRDTQGVSVAVGDVNGDGKDEIIAGHARGAPEVKVFNGRGVLQNRFVAGSSTSKSGIEVSSVRALGGWQSSIITSSRSCFFCGQ